jgi:nitroreductase
MKYDLSEITEVIRNRRTIYPEQFTERVVQRDMVELMLTNAMWAPTHGKTQPWRFKVYRAEGRNELWEVVEKLYMAANPDAEPDTGKIARIKTRIDRTSCIIAMVMARTPETKIPEIEEVEAVACAAQNIMLTATAYGLGSFWSSPGFLSKPEAAVHFGYGEADKVLGLMYLGYPDGEWPKSHRKPLEYVTTWVGQ